MYRCRSHATSAGRYLVCTTQHVDTVRGWNRAVGRLVMVAVDGRRRRRKSRPGPVHGRDSAGLKKRLERIIVTLRLTVVRHHAHVYAHAHLVSPSVVAISAPLSTS